MNIKENQTNLQTFAKENPDEFDNLSKLVISSVGNIIEDCMVFAEKHNIDKNNILELLYVLVKISVFTMDFSDYKPTTNNSK